MNRIIATIFFVGALFWNCLIEGAWIERTDKVVLGDSMDTIYADILITDDKRFHLVGQNRWKSFRVYHTTETGSWICDTTDIRVDSEYMATENSALSNGNALYIAWTEGSAGVPYYTYRLHVRKYENGAWSLIGTNLNVNQAVNASYAKLAMYNNILYVAWVEDQSKIYVKQYDGNEWTLLGQDLSENNKSAERMTIAMENNEGPYVIWQNTAGFFPSQGVWYVKKYNGTAWEQVGDYIHVDASAFISLKTMCINKNGTVYVVWSEYASDGCMNCPGITYLAKLENDQWVLQNSLDLKLELAADRNINGVTLQGFGITPDDLLYCSWSSQGDYLITKETIKRRHIIQTLTHDSWGTIADEWMDDEYNLGSMEIDVAFNSGKIYRLLESNGTAVIEEHGTRQEYLNQYCEKNDITVLTYPHPARTAMYFNFPNTTADSAEIEIYNMVGERITMLRKNNLNNEVCWELQNIGQGIYIVRIKLIENGRIIKTLVKKVAVVK